MEGRQVAPKRIAFFGHFNTTNFGNESTLQAILYHLRRFLPVHFLCISSGPEATAATHQIKAIPMNEVLLGAGCLAPKWGSLFRLLCRATERALPVDQEPCPSPAHRHAYHPRDRTAKRR